MLAGTVALLPVRRRRWPPTSGLGAWRSWGTLLALVWAAGLGLMSLGGSLLFFTVDYTIAGPVIAVLATAVFLVTLVAGLRRTVERPPGLPDAPMPS